MVPIQAEFLHAWLKFMMFDSLRSLLDKEQCGSNDGDMYPISKESINLEEVFELVPARTALLAASTKHQVNLSPQILLSQPVHRHCL